MQNFRRLGGAVALAVAMLVAGCGGDGPAFIRVLNTSPGTQNVDVRVNGTAVAQGAAFGKFSPSNTYFPTTHGSNVRIDTYVSGATSPFNRVTANLLSGHYYTLLVTGNVSSGDIKGTLLEDTTVNADTTKFLARVIHGSPAAGGPVDIYVTPANIGTTDNPVLDTLPLAPGTTPTIPNLAFGAVTSYLSVDASMAYRIRIYKAGDQTPSGLLFDTVDNTSADTTTSSSAGVMLNGGSVYTLVAVDNTNSSGPQGPGGFTYPLNLIVSQDPQERPAK